MTHRRRHTKRHHIAVAVGMLAGSACSHAPAAVRTATATTTTTSPPETTTTAAPATTAPPTSAPEAAPPTVASGADPAPAATRTTATTVLAPAPSTVVLPVDPPLNPPELVGGGTVEEAATGACGGRRLPPCSVMRAESGGNIRAVNRSGCGGRGCYGKWQFDPITSRGLGYTLTMDQYDEATQDEAAATLWAGGAGCGHWAAC